MFWEKLFGEKREDTPDAEEVELPAALPPGQISAETLAALAENVDAQIKAIELLIRQSGHDAQRFSRSLEAGAAKLADPARAAKAIADLVHMTRAMVEKTRMVETRLREQTEEMALLNAGLTEARQESWNGQTGLANRREFERELGSAVERARLQGHAVSVALCDVESFTAINDLHGPETGDRVLAYVGKLLVRVMDKQAIICRGISGEFLILFDGLSARQSRELAEEARQKLVERNIVDSQTGRRVGHINFSAGIASISADYNISLMLKRADRALQRAKTSSGGSVKIAY